MKALSTSILIVVTAVVILVAALVVLTIFGGGVGTVTTVSSFRSQCATQCQMTCKMGGALPPTWSMEATVGGTRTSCVKEFPSGCGSAECGSVATTTTTTTQGCCRYPNGNCITNPQLINPTSCVSGGGTWTATCPSNCN